MSTPNSKTAISNLALRHLKTDPVVSIEPPDSDSKAAEACAAWYDQARRDTLEAHPWQFARKRREIVAEVAEPTFEYAKKYQLPPDYIRAVRFGQFWDDPELDYEIEDGYIICDFESPLQLVYIYNQTDTSKFSPKFITALSYKMAELMAFEITGNAQLVAAMAMQFDNCFMKAASVSGQNRPTRRVQRSRIRDARQNMSRGRDWRRWGDE